MKVLVAGSTGFIGGRLVEALRSGGHQVVGASRHSKLPLDYARMPSASALRALVQGCQVVINAVGILRERGSQTFHALHDAGPRALFSACADAGVPRVIQISALGAEAGATARYHLSKHEADRHLQGLPLDWAIVQPSLVYGPGGSSAQLFDMLASLPILPLPSGGIQRVQPVHIDDVVAAVVRLVESPATLRCVLPVVGPHPLTLREFLGELRGAFGESAAPVVPVPRPLVVLTARLGDYLPGSFLDSETLGMLERGNTADAKALRQWLGRDPQPVRAFIPAAEAPLHRSRAALSWLLPLLRIGVAAMWFFAAIVSMGPYPIADSLALLRSIDAPAELAPVLLGGAIVLNLLLGILTLAPRRPRWLWTAQIGLVLAYTAIISWKLPALWLEPFGPVAKNIPILAMLLLLRQLDRRA